MSTVLEEAEMFDEEKERTLLLWLTIGILISAIGLIGYGGLAGWWTYVNGAAFMGGLVIVGVILYVWGPPGLRAFLVVLGGLFVLSFIITACGLLNEGIAKALDSATRLADALNPTVVFVQNTGQYDSIKYGTGQFWLSLGGQFLLAMALVLLSFVTRGRTPFNILMVLINIGVAIVLISYGGQHANPETAAAESTVFTGAIMLMLYWESIAQYIVLRFQTLPDNANTYWWTYVLLNVLSQPATIMVTALASVIFIGIMITLVNVTAMTMSQALTLAGQGAIVATLFEGVLIELASFGRGAQIEGE